MDKSKVIENPIFQGCLNCSTTPKTILSKNKVLYLEFANFNTSGKCIQLEENTTMIELEEKYKDTLADGDSIFLMSAFHDETYTYDGETKEWYLTKQGEGYA